MNNINIDKEKISKGLKDIYSSFDNLTINQKQEFLKQIEYKNARDNYIAYLKLCYPDMIICKVHIFLANLMETIVHQVEKGENIRIILNLPPRHGKSMTITETLPSWFIGRNPNKGAIITAYNADLAEQFEDSNRQKTKNYGKQVFGIEVSETQDNKTLYRLKKHKGGIIGVGLSGGLTGNTGSWHLAIIDDPYKNGDEADSKNERDKKERVFRDSIITRLSGKGSAIIIIQTRWHEDDLSGKLGKEKGWSVINIPCLSEKEDIFLGRIEGETLCPELGFDANWALRTQEAVGKKVWNALYQGRPTALEGNELETKYFKFYSRNSMPNHFDRYTQTWDLSFGDTQNADYVSGQVWGKIGADHYLIKRIKKKLNFPETCNYMRMLSQQYPLAIKKIVEKKANGQAIIDTLNREIGGIEPFIPKDSKISRVRSIIPYFVAGNVYFPDESLDPLVKDFVEELSEFPNGKHDDEVDAMTQYIINDNISNIGRFNFEELNDFRNIRLGFSVNINNIEEKGRFRR